MLQLQNISKTYRTGDLVQKALDGVSLNLRDNEFVAILGPSGSGKTTLLNVIGGLDRYDSGDLVVGGVSTKRYQERDWDSYRNHTIGFVFQSYNLIPHQSVLSNVELALTISGVSKAQRKKRAREALERVGLGDQCHKRPNQMSGGQMQRVAIARALVNDPDILLADEPTGALDTETSVQVMELLKEVAKDRLVVMVTHNPELAQRYATRTVKLRDGRILDDSRPFQVDPAQLPPPEHRNLGKSSMSFLTALSLSFHNLRTKKGRTLLTSFAGSIGIIGIALILSLSTGVNRYITHIQKETMASYPVSVEARTFDLSSIMREGRAAAEPSETGHERDGVWSSGRDLEMASTMTTSVTENNLTAFKKYLEDPDSEIRQYIGENGVAYSYATRFSLYSHDPEGELVCADGSTFQDTGAANAVSGMGQMASMRGGSGAAAMGDMSAMLGQSSNHMAEITPERDGDGISPMVTDSYELVYGEWPQAYDQVVLVLDENHEIPAEALYELGVLPAREYREYLKKIDAGEEIETEPEKQAYEDICAHELILLPACDLYQEDESGNYVNQSGDEEAVEALLEERGVKLKITGILRPREGKDNLSLNEALGYTAALTNYLREHTAESAVVKAQEARPEVSVTSGLRFSPANDQEKAEDAKLWLSRLGVSDKAAFGRQILLKAYEEDPQGLLRVQAMDEAQLAESLDRYLEDPQKDALLEIYDNAISPGSYEDSMEAFGVVSEDAPSAVRIYVDSFEDKDAISDCIQRYNDAAEEKDRIAYTDYVALLMSSVTTIINVISYVLIAFVGVSLVVSSIMIGIITYISVLERTKEIGILRAMGASRHNISQVFNAETFIIGLCAGLIGVGVTLLLLIPGNAAIHALAGTTEINAALPVAGAVVLVALSMLLTLAGGLIPSKKAAHKDPVTALRTE